MYCKIMAGIGFDHFVTVLCGKCAASPRFRRSCLHLTAPQLPSYYGVFMSFSALTKMNNYQLIQNIKIRRPLWDKALWDKIDGPSREVMWEDVAEQMGNSKGIVKARWKNLRDSYRKLLLRAEEKYNPENAPKWRYFRHMEFIKGIVLNTKSKVNDISVKNTDITLNPDYTVTFDSDIEGNSTTDPLSFSEVINNASANVEKDAKRRFTNSESENFPFISSEFDKQSAYENFASNYANDDDLQFLLSLYPHFKKVPMNKKLLLRMKFESIIHDEIYSGDNNMSDNSAY